MAAPLGLRGLGSPSRDRICAPCSGSVESYLLDSQGIPSFGLFLKSLHNLRKMGKKEPGQMFTAVFLWKEGIWDDFKHFPKFFMLVLTTPSLCSWCTVRPNKLKLQSLEQRKVYCRAKQGERRLVPRHSLTPNSLKSFSKAFLKLIFIGI